MPFYYSVASILILIGLTKFRPPLATFYEDERPLSFRRIDKGQGASRGSAGASWRGGCSSRRVSLWVGGFTSGIKRCTATYAPPPSQGEPLINININNNINSKNRSRNGRFLITPRPVAREFLTSSILQVVDLHGYKNAIQHSLWIIQQIEKLNSNENIFIHVGKQVIWMACTRLLVKQTL